MALAAALPVFGGEYAVLANGFRIRAERHEVAGSSVRLFTQDGVTELPATLALIVTLTPLAAPPDGQTQIA